MLFVQEHLRVVCSYCAYRVAERGKVIVRPNGEPVSRFGKLRSLESYGDVHRDAHRVMRKLLSKLFSTSEADAVNDSDAWFCGTQKKCFKSVISFAAHGSLREKR